MGYSDEVKKTGKQIKATTAHQVLSKNTVGLLHYVRQIITTKSDLLKSA